MPSAALARATAAALLAAVWVPAARAESRLTTGEEGSTGSTVLALIVVLALSGCVGVVLMWAFRTKVAEDGSIWGAPVFDGNGEYETMEQAAANYAVKKAKEDPKAAADLARRVV